MLINDTNLNINLAGWYSPRPNKPKYLFENGYLYFPIQKSPGIVKIKLLAEDPLEAKKYPSLCEDCQECVDCTPAYDYPFDIDGDLIEPLISMVEKR